MWKNCNGQLKVNLYERMQKVKLLLRVEYQSEDCFTILTISSFSLMFCFKSMCIYDLGMKGAVLCS